MLSVLTSGNFLRYTDVCVYMYTCMNVCNYVSIYVCIFVCWYVCMHVRHFITNWGIIKNTCATSDCLGP